MKFEILSITARPIYICCECGKQANGSVTTIEGNYSDNLSIPNYNMPDGWGSYYKKEGDIFRCPKCLK